MSHPQRRPVCEAALLQLIKIKPQRLTDQFEGWVDFLVFSTKGNFSSFFSFLPFLFIPSVIVSLHNFLLPNLLSLCVIISIFCWDTELKWTRSSPTESASPPILFSFRGGGGCGADSPPRSQRQAWQDKEVRWELAEELCPWNIWVKYTHTHFYTKNTNWSDSLYEGFCGLSIVCWRNG